MLFSDVSYISPIYPAEMCPASYGGGMADGSDMTLTMEQPASGVLVDGLRAFVGDHGGATAVIEYVGRRGARIVLIGEDGVWADQFASATDVARTACAEAGVVVENSWERELMDHMRPSSDLWRSMEHLSPAR